MSYRHSGRSSINKKASIGVVVMMVIGIVLFANAYINNPTVQQLDAQRDALAIKAKAACDRVHALYDNMTAEQKAEVTPPNC